MSSAPEVLRYKALIEAARRLNSAMDVNAILSQILASSREVMAAEAISVFMDDPATGELVLHAAAGDPAQQWTGETDANGEPKRKMTEIRVPRGAGISGHVFEHRKSINIHDVQNDPRFYRKADSDTGFVTRSMITVPLLTGDRCLGVVQALNSIDRPYFDDLDLEIFEGFASLIAGTLLRLENQSREMSEARARQELDLAREIQQSFLPPPLRILNTCQVRVGYFPARQIGGDFYFVHPLDENRTLMGLGDVTGKGIPAALTMSRATAEIKGLAGGLKDDLGAWVSSLNTIVAEELSAGRFIGMTFLLCDSRSSTMQICAAGQYPPVWSDAARWNRPAIPSQLPIGILSGYPYKSETLALKPGQIWVLFSDGITEARNEAGEEFTEEHFLKRLPLGLSGAHTFDQAIEGWKDFVGKAEPHDDASLLMLDWRGNAPANDLAISCQTENLCTARTFIEDWAKYAGFDDITIGQIVLAADEATTNVFRYAYGGKPGPIDYHVSIDNNQLVIQIRDHGTPVDPSKVQGRKLEDLRPGGLGVVLLHKVFGEVTYEPQQVGTLLTLRKKIM
ncbi:MAG: SpoIIE family protein phosphatase [Methylacidiphilales bacterium]|nr:SpoIIE family protein phosphatase [Candidatus Methylacidiphilales bacterium]